MKLHIAPSKLQGALSIPPSKSHSIRAILFGLMASGISTIENLLPSPDIEVMIRAIQHLGAKVRREDKHLEIEGVAGVLHPAEDVIDVGNSGLALRFITALGALQKSYTIITGDHSIRHRRPMMPLLEGLQQLGAEAISSRLDGYAPIIVRGPMHRQLAHIAGEDSQPVSALLIACSFLLQKTTLIVDNPGETPWIDMTLHWLRFLGAKVTHTAYSSYEIGGGLSYNGFCITIPGDLSSLAYPVGAALVTGSEITLHGVDLSDVQGDKRFIEILLSMGADIEVQGRTLTVKKGQFRGGRIDINDCIDMVTIFAVLACFAKEETEITGASIARYKESNRLSAITQELKKMGACIEETPDGLSIKPSSLRGAHLHTHEDHRVGLALSVAALGAQGKTTMDNTACIAKTYPDFQRDFSHLGACIQ